MIWKLICKICCLNKCRYVSVNTRFIQFPQAFRYIHIKYLYINLRSIGIKHQVSSRFSISHHYYYYYHHHQFALDTRRTCQSVTVFIDFNTTPICMIYHQVPIIYKTYFSRQLNNWSLRCSWSIACRRCFNYIFIFNLTLCFNILRLDNCKPRRETFKFWNLLRLILEILRYFILWNALLQL